MPISPVCGTPTVTPVIGSCTLEPLVVLLKALVFRLPRRVLLSPTVLSKPPLIFLVGPLILRLFCAKPPTVASARTTAQTINRTLRRTGERKREREVGTNTAMPPGVREVTQVLLWCGF